MKNVNQENTLFDTRSVLSIVIQPVLAEYEATMTAAKRNDCHADYYALS